MDDKIHSVMGAMTALNAVLIGLTAKRVNSSTIELVFLEEKFAGRTAELDDANRKLIQEIEKHKQTDRYIL
jgi:hypothetical protein